jgi:hypothetical protein
MKPHVLPTAASVVACFRIVATGLLMLSSVMQGQQAAPVASPVTTGHNWANVKALPPNIKVHITTDHGGKTCRIFSVSDDLLTCSKGNHTAGDAVQRTQIQRIKLTHYIRSTLIGAGIGGGIGAIAGAIAGKTKPCPPMQTFCLNGLGIGAGGVATIFGVGAGVVGGVAGGPTDFARGSSIYTRP